MFYYTELKLQDFLLNQTHSESQIQIQTEPRLSAGLLRLCSIVTCGVKCSVCVNYPNEQLVCNYTESELMSVFLQLVTALQRFSLRLTQVCAEIISHKPVTLNM